jgi:hypothetical protein
VVVILSAVVGELLVSAVVDGAVLVVASGVLEVFEVVARVV